MTDSVAIISVVGSTLVGLGGLASTVWGQRAARRWQSREERVAELRGVLDTAAEKLASATQAIAEAHEAIRAGVIDPSMAQRATTEARQHLAAAMEAQDGIWLTVNRLRVRTGWDSAVALAFANAEREIGLLGAVVRRKLATPALPGYEAAWAKARAAEKAFFDAAAAELRATKGKRSRIAPPPA